MFDAVRFVRDHCPPDIDATAHHVAMVIASFTRRDGTATVGARKLAEHSRLNTTTIARAIRRLEEAGVIAVTRPGEGLRSVYRFPVSPAMEVVPNRVKRAHGSVVHNRATSHTEPCEEVARVGLCEHVENAHATQRPIFLPGTGWVQPAESRPA